MKLSGSFLAVIPLVLCGLSYLGLVNGQDDEYEYYYEDEISTPAVTTTTVMTTTTASTRMTRTATTKKQPTRRGQGNSQTIVVGPNKNGQLVRQPCNTCLGYQYGRPDVVFNVIADMYDLQSALPGGNRYSSGNRYSGVNRGQYASRFEEPLEYWYGLRQPSRPVRRPPPALIDYGVIRQPVRRPQQETVYVYEEADGELYTDYYEYEYDYPLSTQADARKKGTNRAIFNFVLNALGPNRRVS